MTVKGHKASFFYRVQLVEHIAYTVYRITKNDV